MASSRFSIAGIVIVGLVTATTLLLGALGFLGYESFSARQRAEFRQASAALADQLAASLTLPLWNFDREQIGKISEGAMRQEDVYRVEVRPRGEITRAELRSRDAHWKITATAAAAPSVGVRAERRVIVTAGEVIGELELWMTERFLEARLRQTARTIVAAIALLDVVLVVGLYALLWVVVLRPLKELEQHALAVSSDSAAIPAPPRRRYFGELANLRHSLVHMIGLLKTRYAEAAEAAAQQRLLAKHLRESEEKFAKIFQASPISIHIAELSTARIVEANDAFFRTFDTSREEAIGRTTLELGFWNDPADRESAVAAMHRAGGLREFKLRGRKRTGAPLTVSVNCEPIELGRVQFVLAMVQDITEREKSEEALRESEEKFSKAFHSGPDAMAIAELETGRYLDVNEGFERLFGYARTEVIGRTSLDLGIWGSAAEREVFMAPLRAGRAVRNFERDGVNRRGEPLTFLVSAESMMLGGRRCVVSAVHDITDRKRAEAERALAVAREVQARNEFTRRLIAAQEAERRRIAGELHDSLGQNLLLVKNRAQLALTTGAIPAEQRWQFESIHDMAAQAIAEVRQISHDLRPYQLDQLGLTRALEGMIDGAGRNSGFPFERKLDPVDDVFAGEAATHFFRIVQESVNNILKHARAARARILVERDVHEVRLWIEDDGRGFPLEAPVSADGGFGLRNIAERARILAGALRIDSAPGKGTRLELIVKIAHPG